MKLQVGEVVGHNSRTLDPTTTRTYSIGGRGSILYSPSAAMVRPPGLHAYQPLPADTDDDATSRVILDQVTLGMYDPNDSISVLQARRAGACYQGHLYKKRERCCGLLKPCWQSRYFVIVGRFLYRFGSAESSEPKGAPLAVEGVDVRTLEDEILPYAFLISTLGKAVVVAADSADARTAWMHALRKAKQRAIKEGLGHAVEKKEHATLNKKGSKLMQRKWIERRVEGGKRVEMRTLGEGGVGGFVDPHY